MDDGGEDGEGGGFARRLAREAEVWRREGVVTDAQAKAIVARYAGEARAAGRRQFASVLGLLGAILVGVGVVVFVAANWESIPGAARLAGLFAATAAAYHAGYVLRYGRATLPGTGFALLFLGAMLYGASLFVVAQAFHVNANAPSLLALWAAGVLPMAYVLRAPEFALLAGLALSVGLGWEASFWVGDAFGAFFPAYLLFGALLVGVGRLHEDPRLDPGLRRFGGHWSVLGLVLALGALLPVTFPAYAAADPGGGGGPFPGMPPGGVLRLLLLGGAALLAAAALAARSVARRRGGGGSAGFDAAEAAVLAAVALSALGLAAWPGVMDSDASAVGANFAMLALVLGVVAAGYRRGSAAWINVGVLFFSLLILARYFDVFWNLLPRALFLVGAGVLLIAGGVLLERTRRAVVVGAAARRAERREGEEETP